MSARLRFLRDVDRQTVSACLMSNIGEHMVFLVSYLFLFSSSDMSPNSQLEQEKRVRREVANSNERRRMQSINTGFQTLKILIPHSCGEKLSKVSYRRTSFER